MTKKKKNNPPTKAPPRTTCVGGGMSKLKHTSQLNLKKKKLIRKKEKR